jgi:hypothetical protein
MSKPPPTYTRLTRRTGSVSAYQSLWLAADHLLILKSTGYTEEYQRLHLRDIKGFFVVASGRRTYWGLPWGIMAAFSGIMMIYGFFTEESPVVSSILFGLSAIALVWNYLLGAGCRAYVVTGVQTAPLPSLVRRPKTRKILSRLEPLILAAQADLVSSAPASESAPGTLPSPL